VTIGLDTSVVVRLLIGVPTEQADAARRALDAQPRSSVAVSDLVVGESYFALRHHYQVPHARAVAALSALLADSRIRATGVAAQVLAQLPAREPNQGLMDHLIHANYRNDEFDTLTFDKSAARLPGARLLTP
jgi:predicted nucleic acid-binding protein